MAHQRKLIRHAVRDLLLAANTAAEDRVETTRVTTYRKGDLPAISVYTIDEAVDPKSKTTAPRELTRDLKLHIEAWVAPGDDADDRMDDLAEQIEAVMDFNWKLSDTAADSILESCTMSVRPDGDAYQGLLTLIYAVTYRTNAPEAPTGLDDFLRVDAKFPTPTPATDANTAEDLFNVRGP